MWLARWTSDLKVGGWSPSPCHCVVSLDKKLYRHFLSPPRRIKWVPSGGNTAMD